MKKGIYLDDIHKHLDTVFIVLNKYFLKKLIIEASGSDFPEKEKDFCSYLDFTYNESAKKSLGLYALIKYNKSISIKKVRRLVARSSFSWSDVEKNIISIRTCMKNVDYVVNFPIVLNHSLGLIIGHILGDGSLEKKYKQVFYTNKDIDLVNEFERCMAQVFSIKPRIWRQISGKFLTSSKWERRYFSLDEIVPNSQIGLFYPSICGVILHAIAGEFAFGKTKIITPEILSFPKSVKIGIIRAFFDDDGHLDKDRGPRFFQDDKELLEDIRLILFELGIEPCPVRTYLFRRKERYFFNINGKKNYSQYLDIIGCTSKKKHNSLRFLVEKTIFSKNK